MFIIPSHPDLFTSVSFAPQALVKPGSMKSHDNIEGQVYVLTKDEGGSKSPITPFRQLSMFSKTWRVNVQTLLENMVMPGEDAK